MSNHEVPVNVDYLHVIDGLVRMGRGMWIQRHRRPIKPVRLGQGYMVPDGCLPVVNFPLIALAVAWVWFF